MEPYRNGCILGPFIRMYKSLTPSLSAVKIFALYLSDKNPKVVKNRALTLYSMKLGWHALLEISL